MHGQSRPITIHRVARRNIRAGFRKEAKHEGQGEQTCTPGTAASERSVAAFAFSSYVLAPMGINQSHRTGRQARPRGHPAVGVCNNVAVRLYTLLPAAASAGSEEAVWQECQVQSAVSKSVWNSVAAADYLASAHRMLTMCRHGSVSRSLRHRTAYEGASLLQDQRAPILAIACPDDASGVAKVQLTFLVSTIIADRRASYPCAVVGGSTI